MDRKKALKIWSKLKSEGSELSLEAADCLVWAMNRKNAAKPQEAPPSVPKELHPLHREIILIFQGSIRHNRRDTGEMTAWSKLKGTITQEEVDLIKWFYGLDKSDDYDATWNRKNAAAALMNQFDTQLALAEKHKQIQTQPSSIKLGAPTKW